MKIKVGLLFLIVLITSSLFFSSNFVNGASSNETSFANPLSSDSIEGVLSTFLTALQKIIATLAIVFIVIGGLLYITSAGDDNQTKTAKKAITSAMIGLAIAIAAPSFLKEIYTILGLSSTNTSITSALSISDIALNILKFLLSIIGVLAVIMLVIGGMSYITAAGDENKLDKGRKMITYSIIGIVVSLSAVIIVRQIAEILTN